MPCPPECGQTDSPKCNVERRISATDVCDINVGEACEFTVGTQKLAGSMPIGCDADNRGLASAQAFSELTHLQAGSYPI